MIIFLDFPRRIGSDTFQSKLLPESFLDFLDPSQKERTGLPTPMQAQDHIFLLAWWDGHCPHGDLGRDSGAPLLLIHTLSLVTDQCVLVDELTLLLL